MIVKNSTKENNTVTFQVELDSAEFEEHVAAAYKKNRSRIQVPGFRKGKASRMVVEGFYGKDVFYEDAVEDAASGAFIFGVEQEGLRVVGRPSITDTQITDEKGAVLTFSTDVWPEVTLGQYKGLEAEKDPCDVTEEEISRDIERLRKQNARLLTVERGAENGDTVNIDYTGTRDGVAFAGGTAEGYNLVLGSNSFILGFEEKLIGITAGEERDLELTFPENYHSQELAGQDVVFHVKCNEVKFEELPEVDDDFAQDNDYDSVEEMKKAIEEKLRKGKETVANNAFSDRLVNAAAANMTVDIPASMIEERMDALMEDYNRYISGQGMPFEKYLQMMGTTYENFRATTRPAAEAQTRTNVLLDAVITAEGLEATEEDFNAEYEKMSESYSMPAEDIKKYIDAEALKEQILRNKAIAVITESGIAVPPKAAEAEPAAEEMAEPAAEE